MTTSGNRPRWIPPALLLLGLLMLAMIGVAMGVIFDWLPSPGGVGSGWTAGLGGLNRLLPVGSSLVGLMFVVAILRRFAERGGAHLLVWGIGMLFFATGSITEALHGLLGWSAVGFRFWYLFGAVLIAAWMGQGTVYLLASRRLAHGLMAVLLVASGYAALRVFTATLDPALIASRVTAVETAASAGSQDVLGIADALLSAATIGPDGRRSARREPPVARAVAERRVAAPAVVTKLEGESPNLTGDLAGMPVAMGHREWLASRGMTVSPGVPGDRRDLELLVARDHQVIGRLVLAPAVVLSGHVITTPGVRGLTPFFNIFGILTLIGGALYSAWVFWRRRIMLHRAAGNVLIAAGAILGGGASAFSRFGMLGWLYAAELSSLLVMFTGFLLATRSPAPAPDSSRGRPAP